MLDLEKEPDELSTDLSVHELAELKAKRHDKILNPEITISRQNYQELLLKSE